MNSKYIKELEEEIKKTKAENDLHFNMAKLNLDKIAQKENISNKIQPNSRNEQEKMPKNQTESKNLNNSKEIINIINHKKEEKNNKNDEIEQENNGKSKNEVINNKRKVTKDNNNNIKNFQICQCCNKEFESKNKIPILLKCNHIFCKPCLENYFIDEEGIKCPIDGYMGKCINDIKILNLFEEDNNNDINEHEKNKMYNTNFLINKSRSNKELLRNKPKDLTIPNSKTHITHDKMRNNIFNNKNFHHSNSSNKKKNSFLKKYSINESIYKPRNKASSFIGNNSINISKINKNKTHSISNLNEKYSLDNSKNSEYYEEEYIQSFCSIHPEQRITHFVEETKELICIHCAFNKLKNNPLVQIKEIPEKCKEYINDLDIIIENNQKCTQIIHNSLNDINENKENEEKKLIEIYEQLLNVLITNRNNYLIKIEEIYRENTNNMNQKLESFSENINIAEKLKEDFSTICNKAPYEFNHLTETFNTFIREINDKNNSDLEINQYNFSHDELNKVIKYLNNFADVKTRKKTFRFDLLKNSKNNITIEEVNDARNGYNSMSLYKNGINNYFKKNKSNKIQNINYRNSTNDLDIKNNSLLQNIDNNLRFKFKYEDENDIKKSTINLNNNFYNKYMESNNNFNGSSSESLNDINDSLNKYIASTNMIRDSLYNQAPIAIFKNSKNYENNSVNYKNKKHKNKFNEDKFDLLNKYKIPSKKIKY